MGTHRADLIGVAMAMKGLVSTAAPTLMPNVIICMASPRHQVKQLKTLSASPIHCAIHPPFNFFTRVRFTLGIRVHIRSHG